MVADIGSRGRLHEVMPLGLRQVRRGIEQPWQAMVEGRVAVRTRLVAEWTGNEAFTDASCPMISEF
jgi:hypothetical protein